MSVDKRDQDKAPLQLLSCVYRPLADVARVMAFGNQKYRDVRNFRTVKNGRDRYLAATLRHVLAYLDGEPLDPESGLSHLAHGACDLLMAAWFDPPKR